MRAEAEELVGPWRNTADPSAARGVPAHVTLLTPFLPAERVDAGVVYLDPWDASWTTWLRHWPADGLRRRRTRGGSTRRTPS